LKVIEHLEQKKRQPLISFEILPPLKGKSIESVNKILDELVDYQPAFINVTYHRAEYKFKLLENGLFEKVHIRKRPGTVGICAAIQYKYGIDAVPHLVCGGFARSETEDALMDLNYLGINNVLLLRGDAMKNEKNFVPEVNGNRNSLDLVQQAVNLNKGVYLEEDLQDPIKTDFCIGVAGYPEKHFEAPNMQSDLDYLKKKVDAGAALHCYTNVFRQSKVFRFCEPMPKNWHYSANYTWAKTHYYCQTSAKFARHFSYYYTRSINPGCIAVQKQSRCAANRHRMVGTTM
jgi:methylenetetrahydrofolate reductase (NADPH)